MSLASLRQRTYEVLEGTRADDRLSQAVQGIIIALIVLSVTAFVMATVPWLQARYAAAFLWFERFTVAVFTIEYVLRVWSCVENPRFAGRPVTGRLHFIVTPAAIIDLLAILPFFLSRLTGSALDLRAVRALRLFRLMRLLKLGRFSQSVTVFTNVLRSKRFEILVAFVVVSIMLIFASTLMYVAEYRVQPEAFSSIPAAMWWAVVTLTTVGYGNVTPVTTAGRVLGGVIAVLGIGLFALPAGILSSGFEQALDRIDDDTDISAAAGVAGAQAERQDEEAPSADDPPADGNAVPRACPHCGERIVD
jgi:voltage-gated potassium channel